MTNHSLLERLMTAMAMPVLPTKQAWVHQLRMLVANMSFPGRDINAGDVHELIQTGAVPPPGSLNWVTAVMRAPYFKKTGYKMGLEVQRAPTKFLRTYRVDLQAFYQSMDQAPVSQATKAWMAPSSW